MAEFLSARLPMLEWQSSYVQITGEGVQRLILYAPNERSLRRSLRELEVRAQLDDRGRSVIGIYQRHGSRSENMLVEMTDYLARSAAW